MYHRTLMRLLLGTGLILSLCLPGPRATTGTAPQIEVCFVLDTTGSMGGLIAGAKAKIWSIANQMVAAQPTPRLKIALIGYRDRGDAYVTRLHDLDDDIDAVYAHLQRFEASGGGDTPESVNEALHEAVSRVSWSTSRDVLKIIFLVGDCPPHMDYPDDVDYRQSCRAAVGRDLIINTVQCGGHAATTPIWQEIARLAEGSYVAIGQTGDMQVLTTPVDARLAELNVALGETLLPYGGAAREREVRAKQLAAEEAGAPTVADRLAFNLRAGKVVQGGGDLLDDLRTGQVRLADLEAERLPTAMRTMSAAEQRAYLERQGDRRRALQAEIDSLLRERQDHLAAETRRLAAAGRGNAFDLRILEILREQAARKGLVFIDG